MVRVGRKRESRKIKNKNKIKIKIKSKNKIKIKSKIKTEWRLTGGDAAVGDEDLAGYEGGFVRGEVQGQAGYFLGLANALKWRR